MDGNEFNKTYSKILDIQWAKIFWWKDEGTYYNEDIKIKLFELVQCEVEKWCIHDVHCLHIERKFIFNNSWKNHIPFRFMHISSRESRQLKSNRRVFIIQTNALHQSKFQRFLNDQLRTFIIHNIIMQKM